MPIEITREGENILRIHAENSGTEGKQINTTIACQDIFQSEQDIAGENNLLTVSPGDTEIVMRYPLFKAGLAVSLTGLALGLAFLGVLPGRKI